MYILYSFIIGIICITLIDVVGSITSRKYAYPYVYLTPISFAAYVFIGYLSSKGSQLPIALIVPVAVGIYDATIGWDIWMKLGADRERELAKDNPLVKVTQQFESIFFRHSDIEKDNVNFFRNDKSDRLLRRGSSKLTCNTMDRVNTKANALQKSG